MTIEEIVNKGIKGGWRPHTHNGVYEFCTSIKVNQYNISFIDEESDDFCNLKLEQILLDPKFFQAVGKVEGWEKVGKCKVCGNVEEKCTGQFIASRKGWLSNMHRMIDALAEGKTLEEFIKTL